MAVSGKWYGNAFVKAFNKEIDLDTDTIKVSLHSSSYVPDQDTHDYYNDVTNEVTGTGYTAGGATLVNVVVSYNAGTNVFSLDADDVTWSNSTITARYAVLYIDTGTPATSPLLGYVDFGEDKISGGSEFTIQWAADGILKTTVS